MMCNFSNFSFNRRLHLMISYFLLLVVKWFFMIGELFFTNVFTNTFVIIIVRKLSKYRIFSGLYFPTFRLNTEQKKLRIWTLFMKWTIVITTFIWVQTGLINNILGLDILRLLGIFSDHFFFFIYCIVCILIYRWVYFHNLLLHEEKFFCLVIGLKGVFRL